MSGEKNLTTLINSMTPSLSQDAFIFAVLPESKIHLIKDLQPLGTFHEKEGLTIIISKEKAEQYGIEYSGVFQCITLNVHSSLDAVGLTAAVSTKLAQANISANVVAAYYHDHIFIASKDAETALLKLNELAELGC